MLSCSKTLRFAFTHLINSHNLKGLLEEDKKKDSRKMLESQTYTLRMQNVSIPFRKRNFVSLLDILISEKANTENDLIDIFCLHFLKGVQIWHLIGYTAFKTSFSHHISSI